MIEGSCPIHGDSAISVSGFGRVGCSACAEMRKAAYNRRRKNARFDRHPRESMIRVSNALLRERFVELVDRGFTTAERVARSAGYVYSGGRADTQRLQRRLGLAPEVSKDRAADGKRILRYADQVEYDTAVKLCYAMGVDYPAEVGV